jgi:hypothetical protein
VTEQLHAPYDFLNPFMAVALLTAKGQRVPLWTNTEDPGGGHILTPAQIRSEFDDITSIPWVSEVQVTTNLGGYPIITVTLTPPYRDAIRLLDSNLMEWGRTLIEVQLGYIFGTQGLPNLSPVYRGVTTKPEIQLGAETVIKLHAHGVGAYSMVRNERGLIVNGQTRKFVLDKLIEGNQEGDSPGIKNPSGKNFSLNTEAFDKATDSEINAEQKKRWTEEKINFAQGYKSDFQAVMDLCLEALCWPVFIGSELHIIARGNLDDAPQFVLSLFDFENGTVGPSTGVYPILGATSPTMHVYMPPEQFGLRQSSIKSAKVRDPKTKEPEVEEKIVGDIGQPTGGGKSAQQLGALDPAAGAPAKIADTNNPLEDASAQYEYERSRVQAGVVLQLDSLGIPDIVPGSVINVRGLGVRISGPKLGNYAVRQVTHTYNTSGFITSLDCWVASSPLNRSHGIAVIKPNFKEAEKKNPNSKNEVDRKADPTQGTP